MSGKIGAYLVSVATATILLSLVQSLLPKGAVKQVAGFVGGLLVVLAVLSPIVKIDPEEIVRSASRFQRQTRSMTQQIQTENEALMAPIIKERCETYILDKARQQGAEIQAEVTLEEQNGYPCPVSVVLTGAVTPEQRAWLTQEISQSMGIPAQRQEWILR